MEQITAIIAGLVVGFLLGLGVAFLIGFLKTKTRQEFSEQMKPLEKIPELLADLQRDSEGKHQQVGEAIKNATQEMQRVQETTGI